MIPRDDKNIDREELAFLKEARLGANGPLYKHVRFMKYPTLEEQLDALWHDIANDTLNADGLFFKMREEVKYKYPKDMR